MNLQSQNVTKAAWQTAVEAFEEAPTQWENFVFPLTPFFNLASKATPWQKAQCHLGLCHQGSIAAIDWPHPLGL